MYMRALNIRIVYVGVLSLAAVLGSALRQHDVQAAPAVQAVRQAPAAAPAPKPLPTVTLATVRVSHASAKARPAEPDRVADAVRFGSGGSALPSLRLDMPYYSFGKLLPHVGKE